MGDLPLLRLIVVALCLAVAGWAIYLMESKAAHTTESSRLRPRSAVSVMMKFVFIALALVVAARVIHILLPGTATDI